MPTRINIGRFSKIELLINTTARILKLYEHYNKGTKHSPSRLSELKTEDVDVAEQSWIRDEQELITKDIEEGKFISLCPQYKDGLIVVAVRAEHWMQATWNRQEFILPSLNDQMIAEDEHRKGGHLGVAATVARIRCRFLITGYYFPKISQNHCHKCIVCKRIFQRLSGQVMASLPLEQLQPLPPFHMGQDRFLRTIYHQGRGADENSQKMQWTDFCLFFLSCSAC